MTCSLDVFNAVARSIGAIAAITAVFIAWNQLKGLKRQLQANSLGTLINLEKDINERKAHIDEVSFQIRSTGKPLPTKAQGIAMQGRLDAAVENYLNSLDRLCYCFIQNYFPEINFRAEYRDYLANAIDTYKEKFTGARAYKNIKDLNERWQRS